MFAVRSLSLLVMFAVAHAAYGNDTPSPEQLFAASTRLMGFEEDLPAIRSISAEAHVTVEATAYDTKVKSIVTAVGFGDTEFSIIRDGVSTRYSDEGGKLLRTVDGQNSFALPAGMAAFIHGHQFHRRTLFPSRELVTTNSVTEAYFQGKAGYEVSGATAAGRLSYFFDKKTGFMLGYRLTLQEDAGPHVMEFTLKDWRISDGKSLFWQMEIDDRGTIFTYDFNKVLLLP